MARPRIWTDTDLRHAVAVATSWRDTARTLGLASTGHTHQLLRKRVWQLGLSTVHFDARPGYRPSASVVVDGTAEERRAIARRSFRRWDDVQMQRRCASPARGQMCIVSSAS